MHQFLKSILFYFEVALYMFRTVFPFVIRSLRLYIQHQVYVIQVQRQLASKLSLYLLGICHIPDAVCILILLMTNGKTVRNMQSVTPK